MPSTVRTARAPTDLKPNLIRVKKRDDERAHRREGGERVKEFQHLGTSDRVVGRPRTGCVARVFYCERMHPQLVNAIIANICSIFIRLIHRTMEAGCVVPKRTGQTPVRSLPRKENGKARTSMDEKSVRKSHGHHIPPAKGMGERALLLLGLLDLLTAADEMRHADAQHRATSDPGEGHAVKTGEREARALLVLNREGHGCAICIPNGGHLLIVGADRKRIQLTIFLVGRSYRDFKWGDGVVARGRSCLGDQGQDREYRPRRHWIPS